MHSCTSNIEMNCFLQNRENMGSFWGLTQRFREKTVPGLKIGDLRFSNPLIMAPMAGITDLPFRRIVKEMGCALVTTEMISANGLIRQGGKTESLLKSISSERPLSVQLFGSDPKTMADAAVIATEKGADVIDINFGCPAKKVLKNGAGAALMRDINGARALLTAVRKAVSVPLTIKIRTGWTASGEEAFSLAQMAEACGIDAVIIHPRTVAQKFSGCADWSLVSRIKEISRIPIIGNGDIWTPYDVLRMLVKTGCDGVMIGRGAVGNPWLFWQSLELLAGKTPSPVTIDMRKKVILKHIDYVMEYRGEGRAALMLRRVLPHYVKSLPRCALFRTRVVQAATKKEMVDIVCGYFETL